MRVSSYNIYVELDNNSNYFFIAHGYTGAMDLIKKEVAFLLRKSNINELIAKVDNETLVDLSKRGYLTSFTESEEKQKLKFISDFSHKKKNQINSFLFAITYNCNFRCSYCYENYASSNGNDWSKSVFSKELVAKAYNAIEKIQPSRDKCHDSIGLYGGEPLLKENLDIVSYIIKLGTERGYNFRATTNGYDLDAYVDLLGKGKIQCIQISIDGLKETHNKRRVHFEDRDTFSKIMDNISLALDKGVVIQNRII